RTGMTEAAGLVQQPGGQGLGPLLEQRQTTYLYDLGNNLLSVTTGINPTEAFQHKVTTSYAYDAFNRRIQTIAAYGATDLKRIAPLPPDPYGQNGHDSPVTQTVYDAADNVI